jgi:hypothetical protein
MATISLAAFTGAQISRIASNIAAVTAGYGADERASFSVFTVNDANGTITFTKGPEDTGPSRFQGCHAGGDMSH